MTIDTKDVWYGQQCEARIGIMADADTDPTSWHYLEYVKLTTTPQQDTVDRKLIGRAKFNPLDPQKGRKGFFRLTGSLVLDADARGLALVLACGLGAPATTGPTVDIYSHVWTSGSDTETYFAIQVKTGDGEYRVYRGLTISAIAIDGKGDQAANYDVTISLKGLSRETVSAALGAAPTALYTQSYAKRLVLLLNDTAADNVMSASWSWDRSITEDTYLSPDLTVRGLRPDVDPKHSGQAQFRAMGSAIDAIEAAETAIDVKLQFFGMAASHDIVFEHPVATIQPAELSIAGPGAIERTWNWEGNQDATHPATIITIKNDVASYT
jgi:hypothetical protein